MTTTEELDIINSTRSEVMGREALRAYEEGLRTMFAQEVPAQDEQQVINQ